MKKLTLRLVVLAVLMNTISGQIKSPVGLWEFNDPENTTRATIGAALELVGNDQFINGPMEEEGAVKVGLGSYYMCSHGISPNGTGGTDPSRVNQYTMVIDFMIPSYAYPYALFNTNATDTSDADAFINAKSQIGVGLTGYSKYKVVPGEWYRLVISADLGDHYDYYINGKLVHSGGPQEFDGRFSLASSKDSRELLLFADDSGEDNSITIARVAIYDNDLNSTEIAELGACKNNLPKPDLASVAMKPYLQSPSPTSIYISWHSALSDESIIEYGITEALGKTATGSTHIFDTDTKWHTVQLTNLEPHTEYYYQCKTGTAQSSTYNFQTLAETQEDSKHIRFVVYGDTRTNYRVHTEVIAAMKNKLIELYGEDYHNDVDLIFNVGDIVTKGGVLSQYITEHFYPIQALAGSIPYMISIGNHEEESPYFYDYMKYEDFKGDEGEEYYSFKIGELLFVALNSNVLPDSQIRWLNKLLSKAQADDSVQMVFAFLHHPGHSEMWPKGNTEWVQDQVIPVLNKFDKVEMLTYGHSHNYESGALPEGNLRLLLSGGGASDLDYWGRNDYIADYPEINLSMDHYCYSIVDVNQANDSYTLETYSLGHVNYELDNVLIDSFVRERSLARPQSPSSETPAKDVYGAVSLQASDYASESPIMSSQFQLNTLGGTQLSTVVDTIRDWQNIYGDSGHPDYKPINLNQGIDLSKLRVDASLLTLDHAYSWRVRYRDQNLNWSEWSEEQVFTYKGAEKKKWWKFF